MGLSFRYVCFISSKQMSTCTDFKAFHLNFCLKTAEAHFSAPAVGLSEDGSAPTTDRERWSHLSSLCRFTAKPLCEFNPICSRVSLLHPLALSPERLGIVNVNAI